MTELMMHFRGRDISIHTSPEGLDRVAQLLVELARRAEREQAVQAAKAESEPARE